MAEALVKRGQERFRDEDWTTDLARVYFRTIAEQLDSEAAARFRSALEQSSDAAVLRQVGRRLMGPVSGFNPTAKTDWQQNLKLGARYVERAIALEPEHPESRRLRAQLAFRAGEPERLVAL